MMMMMIDDHLTTCVTPSEAISFTSAIFSSHAWPNLMTYIDLVQLNKTKPLYFETTTNTTNHALSTVLRCSPFAEISCCRLSMLFDSSKSKVFWFHSCENVVHLKSEIESDICSIKHLPFNESKIFSQLDVGAVRLQQLIPRNTIGKLETITIFSKSKMSYICPLLMNCVLLIFNICWLN